MRRMYIIAGLLVLSVALAGAVWRLRANVNEPESQTVQTQMIDGLQLTLSIDRAEPGERTIGLRVQDATGTPVDQCAARLQFNMAGMDMGTVAVDAQPHGPGGFRARGTFFTMAGRWIVDSTLACPGRAPVAASFDIPVAAPGEVAGPINPLPADAATLRAGQQLYRQNCAACHGINGRGDGPAASGLSPRPGDFSQHMLPGQHTDGQVFVWIKDGYPGTAMPAWNRKLSDEQIWQLVGYLRSFAEQPPAEPTSEPTSQPDATPTIAQATPDITPTSGITVVQEPLPPLVFARRGNLWASDGSAASPRRLTSLDEEHIAGHPAVSPDGNRLAFIVNGPPPITATLQIPSSTLYVIGTDGTDMRPIWNPANSLLLLPTWAPDGQSLYVAVNGVRDAADDQSANASSGRLLLQIFHVDLANGTFTPVIQHALDPALSRDGSQLAYLQIGTDGQSLALAIASPDGSGSRTLFSETLFTALYAPRFSPDGSVIVFAAVDGPATDERGIPEGSQSRNPLDLVLGLLEPPTAGAHGLLWNVWMIHSDGSGLRRLATLDEDLPMSVFSPDGTQIAIIGGAGIYLMEADGSQLRRIDPTGDHGGLDWLRAR